MKFTYLICAAAFLSSTDAKKPAGGFGDMIPIDNTTDISKIEQFKGYLNMIQEYAGKKYSKLTPISYKQQVVAGMNYTIIYQVGDDPKKTIEVTIYEPLPYMNDVP